MDLRADVAVVRVRLTGAQVSALQCAGLELAPDEDEVALARAFCGRELRFAVEDVFAVSRGLIAAANSEDAMAEDGCRDAASRRFARGARDAMSNLAGRVAAAIKSGVAAAPCR